LQVQHVRAQGQPAAAAGSAEVDGDYTAADHCRVANDVYEMARRVVRVTGMAGVIAETTPV
jgi:hypothetical protein